MIIVKFIRWLRGYVRFTATGGFVERFLNLLAVNSINVWGVRRSGEVFQAYMLASDYKRLRCLKRRTGVRLRITQKRGMPFGARKYRKRIGVLVGILSCLIFLGIMSNFVWEIEVTGNENIEPQVILSQLEEMGLKKGVLKSSLDTRYMEKKALVDIEGIAWMGISVQGSRVVVDVKESTEAPEIIPMDQPCNVVASKSGQIVYLEVYEGQAVLKKGDTVKEGDLVVSGITQDKKGGNTIKHAMAKVIARYTTQIEVKVPLKQTLRNYTGNVVKRSSVDLFGVKMPLYIATKLEGQYEQKTSRSQASLFGIGLPFDVIENEYAEYTESNVTYTEEQALKLAEAELKKKLEADYKDSEIVSKDITTGIEGETFVLRAKCVFEEDIARSEEILMNGSSGESSGDASDGASDEKSGSPSDEAPEGTSDEARSE
ncbi:sporulation protein YqfD [Candidatus Soleaferrea massiliensis]|uniref:sporulation protein YqfD n=1 Tax=Candidatus Soleaferrea massiliensis TaxID=1470354 RepID=UPI00058BCE70|nr:sporulation protein YqfD [Candidatus Soleaferrea massiliensis]